MHNAQPWTADDFPLGKYPLHTNPKLPLTLVLDLKRALAAISELPDAVLKAELGRRDATSDDTPTCGSKSQGVYNTPLHVMALFLILVLSTLACSFPVLAHRFPRLPIPRRFLFISRHFGTGVLIATAFVHLLPTAFISLTDPCLPRFWSQSYRAMAGFVAMISVFAVVLVEMFFAMKGAKHVHGSEYDNLIGEVGRDSISDTGDRAGEYAGLEAQQVPESISLVNVGHKPQSRATRASGSSHELSRSPLTDASGDKDDDLADLDGLDDYMDNDQQPINGQATPLSQSHRRHTSQMSVSRRPTGSESLIANPQRQLLQCLLLEAGILFHSIFIGMALSVATGTSFVVLLIAISFHQTFEGFALGSRIASLIPDLFPPNSPKPWLMCLAYGATTPLGQAIGLVLHNMYDPASTTGLLMVGVTNAISSGLLLFAGLVELLAEDFLSESSYDTLKGRRRVEACLSVAGGALLMALVGAFA
ncbi:unnamed protein product [Penicillium olsonii]|uniref:Zinc/iron permease n=1 Tax=Penicillium olsonii TaxID=99116 RepID=A0A9W4I221_PENOL|nr:unnamed protein product [Penicillium olsonii]CAG8194261.1 unnamed protein product [Penicillium olsonii]CAG8291893.1 unnamed protein product [Penicillium olsonii]